VSGKQVTRREMLQGFALATVGNGVGAEGGLHRPRLASDLAANTRYEIISQFFIGEYYFTQAQGFTSQFGLTLDTGVYGYYGAPPAPPLFATNTYPPNNPGDFGPNFKVPRNMTNYPEKRLIQLEL